jgi:hypothetical protein
MSAVGVRRRWLGWFCLFVVAWAPGCSDGRKWAPVSGRVTLDGEPQEGIYVYFEPELPPDVDPLQGVSKSYARTDADGQYTLNFMDVDKDRPGALISSHTVTADDERTFNNPRAKSRVPLGWKAAFEVTQEGATDANFDLSKK